MRASPLVQRANLFLVRADHFQSQSLPFPTRILTALSQLVPQVLINSSVLECTRRLLQ